MNMWEKFELHKDPEFRNCGKHKTSTRIDNVSLYLNSRGVRGLLNLIHIDLVFIMKLKLRKVIFIKMSIFCMKKAIIWRSSLYSLYLLFQQIIA